MNNIGIQNYTGTGEVDVNVEPVTNLNGAAIAESHFQRFLLALKTDAGQAVDVPGDGFWGPLIQVSRLPRATNANGFLVGVNNTTGALLLGPNLLRQGVFIWNDSTQRLRIKYSSTGALPPTGAYTFAIDPNGFYEMPVPIFTGYIVGLWDAIETDPSKTGANVTELSYLG